MKYALSAVVMVASLASAGFAIAQDLPKMVTDLGLTDIQVRQKPNAKYGRRVAGTLPSGSRIEVDLNGKNEVDDIEARGNDFFPAADIRGLVPAPVLKNASWPADAKLEKIEFEHNGNIEIKGRLANGQEFDAEFSADGRVLEFDTDD
ncbi:MAG TPA: hypothetical protein VNS29_14375 [Burkholderiaceae bacterium]|nr:hypothetical protein [Burkholderiaceae bacterium]